MAVRALDWLKFLPLVNTLVGVAIAAPKIELWALALRVRYSNHASTRTTPLSAHESAYLRMALCVLDGVSRVSGPRLAHQWAPLSRLRHPERAPYDRLVRRWWGYHLFSSAPALVRADHDHEEHCDAILAHCVAAIKVAPTGPAELARVLDTMGPGDSLVRRGFVVAGGATSRVWRYHF